jgi:hypothetical protein
MTHIIAEHAETINKEQTDKARWTCLQSLLGASRPGIFTEGAPYESGKLTTGFQYLPVELVWFESISARPDVDMWYVKGLCLGHGAVEAERSVNLVVERSMSVTIVWLKTEG